MPARFPQEAPLLVVADVQVGWTTVVVSAASVVTALVGLAAWFAAWRTAKATDRTAKAAEEQANAAEEQANAARADLHRTRTPRLDLRIGLDHGDGNVQAELVNRGPLLVGERRELQASHTHTLLAPAGLRGAGRGDMGIVA
jgi:flagellar biosynthesis component FlhA